MRHQLGLRCSLLALLRAFSDSVLSCVSEKPSTVHREEAKGARRGSIAAAFAVRGAPGGAMPRRLSRRRRRTLSGGRRGRVGEAVMTWRLHVLTVHRSQRADFAENAHIRVAGLQFGVASTRASLRVSVSFSSPPGPRAPTTTSRYVGARLNGNGVRTTASPSSRALQHRHHGGHHADALRRSCARGRGDARPRFRGAQPLVLQPPACRAPRAHASAASRCCHALAGCRARRTHGRRLWASLSTRCHQRASGVPRCIAPVPRRCASDRRLRAAPAL